MEKAETGQQTLKLNFCVEVPGEIKNSGFHTSATHSGNTVNGKLPFNIQMKRNITQKPRRSGMQ